MKDAKKLNVREEGMARVNLTRIAVIGMGYVGVPVAALLANKKGVDVTGIQRRSQRSGWKIDVLNAETAFESP